MLTAEKPQRKRRERKPDDTVFIYGLVCPTMGIVRYVGRTFSPYDRLFGHIAKATNTRTRDWFMALVSEGRVPNVITLEVTTLSESCLREKAWILHYHGRHGDRLLNHACIPRPKLAKTPKPPKPKRVAKRIGRPPADDPKVPINCRVPLSLRRRCEEAATSAQVSYPQWVRSVLESASRK